MEYITEATGITPEMLHGFFVDWPNPPTPEKHLKLLQKSDKIVLAIDNDKVVGFITAITDDVLSAYIPFLEVLPDYQSQGIGGELVKRMLELLSDIYMVDLMCDEELQPYYEKLGMMRSSGMILRNYAKQSGK